MDKQNKKRKVQGIFRKKIYQKYNGHCAYCGEKIEYDEMKVDHIRPKSLFYIGSIHRIPKYDVDDIQNLNPACRICNYWKHNFTVEQFRHEISQQVERLTRDSGKFRFALKYKVIEVTNSPVVFYFERTKNEQTK